jgi:UDP-glucose-4-epimerase GalE
VTSVLVTGGAGYVGGVVVEHLKEAGERVVVLDSMERAPRAAIPDGVAFYEGPVGDGGLVARIVADHDVDACMHFAGLISVGESVREPQRYHQSNVAQTATLLSTLVSEGVEIVVFSSSAAVYGDPLDVPIKEVHRHAPTSPYGWTKSAVEAMLSQLGTAGLLRSASLRYFNAAGAGSGRREEHDPETHLIPLALDAASGAGPQLTVFGSDYDTPDGTAIRDYVHVDDLATAHVLALGHLRSGAATTAFNLGNGAGYSVLDVIETVGAVTGQAVPHEMGPRRDGDPAVLVASAELARTVLGWRPAHEALEDIVASAQASRR